VTGVSNQHTGYGGEANPQTGHCRIVLPGLNLVPVANKSRSLGETMTKLLHRLWSEDEGQDIAEYAVMLAVILVIVVGTVRLIGGNANNVFSSVSSSIGS